MTPRRRLLLAVAGVAAVVALQVLAIGRQALSTDEAYHALAGDQADRSGCSVLNLEHPPLVKLVAALPWLGSPPLAPPVKVSEAYETQFAVFTQPGAEARVRWGGRLMMALCFGMPLLGAAFLLGRQLGGAPGGAVLALLLGLDFSLAPLLPLIYTDAAEALAFLLTLLAAARYLERPCFRSAACLGLAFGLALAVKFTGLLLAPTLLAALLLAPGLRAAWPRRLLAMAAALAMAWGTVELTYRLANRHYDRALGRATIELYCANHSTMQTRGLLAPAAPYLLAIERHDPAAAQWLTGLLATWAQNRLGVFAFCNFGHMVSYGRWWYFPLLLLIKTPLALLIGSGCALAAWARRRRRHPGDGGAGTGDAPRRRLAWLVALTAAVFLTVAASSNYNAGLRHILPILPLLYLPAALWAARRPPVAVLLLATLGLESFALAPVWLTSTNSWWLGAHDPLHLAMSLDNAFYPQNLFALREAAARRGLAPLRVIEPALRGVEIDAYLGPGTAFTPPGVLGPGWVAVGASAEVCIPAILRAAPEDLFGYRGLRAIAGAWGPLAQEVRRAGEDHGWFASTFHLYHLPLALPPIPLVARRPGTPPAPTVPPSAGRSVPSFHPVDSGHPYASIAEPALGRGVRLPLPPLGRGAGTAGAGGLWPLAQREAEGDGPTTPHLTPPGALHNLRPVTRKHPEARAPP
jgi:hypothetical protein